MKATKRNWSTVGLSLALIGALGATAFAGDKERKKDAKVGEPAPAWSVKDANGKAVSLADYSGKIVVMQWIDPQCPYIIHCYKSGAAASTLKELKAIDPDIVYLTINSTARGLSGPVSEEEMTKETVEFLKAHKVDVPALSDYEGTVGRSYGAKTTPHIFIIDTEGVLRYEGAFTNNPLGKAEEKGETVINYVVNAVQQIKKGETVSPDSVKSWGCSVRYAKKDKKEQATDEQPS